MILKTGFGLCFGVGFDALIFVEFLGGFYTR